MHATREWDRSTRARSFKLPRHPHSCRSPPPARLLDRSIDRALWLLLIGRSIEHKASQLIEANNGSNGRRSPPSPVPLPCVPLSRRRRGPPRHAGARRRRHPPLHVQCDDGDRDAAVRGQEHPHGERAVPGAQDRRARGRPPHRPGPQQHQQQRHLPLARRPAAAQRVGGRPVVHHAVPDPAGAELRLQLPDHRAARHAVVARALLLAPRHALRPARHPPAAGRPLPVPQAPPGGAPHARRVVQRRPRGGHQAGAADRRGTQRLRRLHLQRPAGPDLQRLRGRRHVPAAGGARPHLHAAPRQLGAQRRALLRRRQPHAHRGRRRRQLRQAVHGRHAGHLPGADHGRAPHRRRRHPALPRLRHRRRALHQHHRHVRQHHRRRHARVRAAAGRRRRAPEPPAAAAPALQRHGRRGQLLGQLPEPRERAVPGAGAPDGGPQVLLRRRARRRPVPEPRQRDVPGAQRHQVRRVHEQRLLRHAQDLPPPGALPAPVQRRAHGQLPGHAGDAVQLHGHAAEQHVRDPRHPGGAAQVQHHRGGGAAGHQHPGRREPPAAPARLRLLRRRHGVRELRRRQRHRQVQPRRPRAAEHHQRAHRRLGRHPLRRRQPRCLDHALPLGRALELGSGNGVARQRRAAAEPEATASAVGHPQVLIHSLRPQQ